MSFEYTITPKDVYGTDTPVIPEGWELTGEFRPWRPGDYFLSSKGVLENIVFYDGPFNHPRLILRRKKVRKVIFTEIRRDSVPSHGEWYKNLYGGILQWSEGKDPSVRVVYEYPPTTIYRREEVEE